MHELRHHGRRLPRHAPGDTQGPRPGSAAEARKPEPMGVTNAGNCTDQPSATVNTTISCNGNCAKVLPCTSQSDREPRLKNNATAVKPRCREAAKARARRRTAAAWSGSTAAREGASRQLGPVSGGSPPGPPPPSRPSLFCWLLRIHCRVERPPTEKAGRLRGRPVPTKALPPHVAARPLSRRRVWL